VSAKISGKVWELELKPTEKFVLLALADHADHEGENVHPGNDLLIAKTGLTQQTITAAIAKFIRDGILEPVNDKSGRGHKREFTLTTEACSRRKFFIEREQKKAQARRTLLTREKNRHGVPFGQEDKSAEKVQSDRAKVQIENGKVQPHNGKVQNDEFTYNEYNRHEPSIEPSNNPGESPNPLLPLLADRYRNIIRKAEDESQLQWQAEELRGKNVTVEQLKSWLSWRKISPAIPYIAEKVLLWLGDQQIERNRQNADAFVGACELHQSATSMSESEPEIEERPAHKGTYGQVLESLAESLPEAAIVTWFEPLTESRVDDGVLHLSAPNRMAAMFRDFIESNYGNEFYAAIERAGLNGAVIGEAIQAVENVEAA
jgi:DNA-binding MarR family transcriptional regulator